MSTVDALNGRPDDSLDSWIQASFGLSIASLVCSLIILCFVSFGIYRDRLLLSRTSFRLSLCMSLAIIVSSACHICHSQRAFMHGRPPIQLRVISWLQLSSELCVALLALCISLHLLLIVVSHQMRVAERLQVWYEAVAIFTALVITHPVLYIGDSVEWTAEILFDGQAMMHRWQIWPMFTAWIAAIIVATLAMLGAICYKVAVWYLNGNGGATSLSKSSEETWGELTGMACHQQRQAWEMQMVTLRVCLYALIPLVTEIWTVASALSKHTVWLYGLSIAMNSTQGILCLLLLAINPASDQFWTAALKLQHKADNIHEELRLDFARLDASTIHLSPYQSRSNSINLEIK